MTRAELRVRIRDEIERRGQAVVSVSEVWAAFNSPGEDTSIAFDAALLGFAAVNEWETRRGGEADSLVFRPAREKR